MKPSTKKTSLALLVIIIAAAAAACTTEELNRKVLVAGLVDQAFSSGETAAVAFHVSRSDMYDANDAYRSLPSYTLRVDDRDVVFETGERVTLYAGNSFSALQLPPGVHFLEVRTADGSVWVSTAGVSLQAGLLHHMVVFGAPAALQQRFYVDDPATVPAGAIHLRLLNALDHGQEIQPSRCPDLELPCAAFGTPIASGDVFEIDEPVATAAELHWWSAEGDHDRAGSQMQAPARSSWPTPLSPPMTHSLMVPIHINSAANPECPGCTAVQAW